MSVIDFPRMQLHTLRMGTIVVVQLDPKATLAPLGDAAVDRAASLMSPRRRLAVLDFPRRMELHIARHWFYPIGRGLPRDAWASVALSPTVTHTAGRAPLRLQGVLPMQNAYVHTLDGFEGPISRLDMTAPSGVSVSLKDTSALASAHTYDKTRLRLGEGWENEPEDVLDARDFANPPPTPPMSLTEPHYRMWLNIGDGDHDDFADPSTLEDELAQLRAIEQEWVVRKTEEVQTKCDRFTHWREALAEQDSWAVDEAPSEPIPSPCDDDEVSPEDAVDNVRPNSTVEDAKAPENQNADVPAQDGESVITSGKANAGSLLSTTQAGSTVDLIPSSVASLRGGYATKSRHWLIRICGAVVSQWLGRVWGQFTLISKSLSA